MKIRVADYIANFLYKKKVKKVFLLSGGGMMHLLDAISRHPDVDYVCNHHEQASAIAAEAYARKSGELGVCYATSGPGATNILTGLIGAWQDSAPVLFITGQSKLSQTIRYSGLEGLRQFGTFEVDIIPIVQSVTKYAVFIDDPNRIKYELEKAYQLAITGRPGPVLIDIPVDIQGALIEAEEFISNPTELSPFNLPDEAVIKKIIKRLSCAKRPLLLIGHGLRVAKIAPLFEKLVKQLNVPVITTPLAKDVIDYLHPLFVGHPGIKGDRAGNFAVQTADVIVSLGSSLHVLTTGYELDQFAPNAYKIQIDLDEKVLQREQLNINEKILCDVKSFLLAVEKEIGDNLVCQSSEWHQRCNRWKFELSVANEPHAKSLITINYYEFIQAINQFSAKNDTIIADAGSAFYVVGQALQVKKDQRVIISGALGSMGYALPAATGACMADPNTRVICITGDGSLQTNVHELAVFSHHQLNVKLFILNNQGYVSIRNTQNNFFNDHIAGVDTDSGVSFPNLRLLAESYKISYQLIKSPDQLKKIEDILNTKGPVFCEILASKEQAIIPTVTSQKLASGKIASKPLHDMFPCITEERLLDYLSFE
jgi:acetolactate synthase I/II/III large subunit